MTTQLIIIGAGGFAQEIAWAARRLGGFELLGCCDDDPTKHGTLSSGLRMLGTIEQANAWLVTQAAARRTLATPSPTHDSPLTTLSAVSLVKADHHFICATGNNRLRAKFAQRATAVGWTAVNVIDPSVLIAADVRLGTGIYIGAGSILSCNAEIGDHVLINQHCTIGHDTLLAAFAQVAPGGRLSGCVILREGALIASNAVVQQNREIGAWATVGAGSFAVTNVPAGATVIGNPATVVFRANGGEHEPEAD